MSEGDDVSRLRALCELVRDFGLEELRVADGTVIRRPPPSPLERMTIAASSRSTEEEDVEDVDLDEKNEAKRARNLETEWIEVWTRAGMASGAPVPKFPGVEKAQAFLERRRA